MLDLRESDAATMRVGGIAAVLSGIAFFAGVGLQFASGWFPEEALGANEMGLWLETVRSARTMALAGIACSIFAITLWAFVGLVLYDRLESARPLTARLGLAGYVAGVPLALVAFVFGFGATWALVGAGAAAESALAGTLMRCFLVLDDYATFLIGGIGNGFFAIAALRSGRLPRWLAAHGMVAAVLVTVVLLRYWLPAFGIAMIGYPLVLLWFVFTGITLVRDARAVAPARAPQSA